MMLAWRGEGSKGVEGPIDNGGGGGIRLWPGRG